MAKRRIINTKFWSDTYVNKLDPSEKLLFLYFLTNPYTNISGAYEISLRQVALDTGFDKEMVDKILKRFKRDGKIYYKDGFIVVKNFIKHQELNPKVKLGIETELEKLPEGIKNIVYYSLSDLNPNSNLNTNPNTNAEIAGKPATPAEVNKNFFEEGITYSQLLRKFSEKVDIGLAETEFKKFTLYWTEPTKNGKKVRWEREPTFDVERRLLTWFSRVRDRRSVISSGRGLA